MGNARGCSFMRGPILAGAEEEMLEKKETRDLSVGLGGGGRLAVVGAGGTAERAGTMDFFFFAFRSGAKRMRLKDPTGEIVVPA